MVFSDESLYEYPMPVTALLQGESSLSYMPWNKPALRRGERRGRTHVLHALTERQCIMRPRRWGCFNKNGKWLTGEVHTRAHGRHDRFMSNSGQGYFDLHHL